MRKRKDRHHSEATEVATLKPADDQPRAGVPGPATSTANSKVIVRRDGDKVIVSVPVHFYRRNGRQMILAEHNHSESDQPDAGVPNEALLTALAKAFAWQAQLESGQFESLEDLAKENGVDRSYVGRLLQLTSLAPDIVESILAGTEYAGLSLRYCRKGVPVSWEQQPFLLHKAILTTSGAC